LQAAPEEMGFPCSPEQIIDEDIMLGQIASKQDAHRARGKQDLMVEPIKSTCSENKGQLKGKTHRVRYLGSHEWNQCHP